MSRSFAIAAYERCDGVPKVNGLAEGSVEEAASHSDALAPELSGTSRRRWVKVSIALLSVAAVAIGACFRAPEFATQPVQAPFQSLQTFRPMAVAALYNAETAVDLRPRIEAEEESIALCTIDLWQAMGRLGQAAIAIDLATENCVQPIRTQDGKMLCAATISGVVAQIGLLTALLSSAASSCALTVNAEAVCASKVGGLVGNMAALSGAASSVYRTCTLLPEQLEKEAAEGVTTEDVRATEELDVEAGAVVRKLKAAGQSKATQKFEDPACTWTAKPEHKALDSKEFNITELLRRQACEGEAMARRAASGLGAPDPARSRSIASCFFDVVQVTGFFSRMGIGIKKSVKICDTANVGKSKEEERKCAVSVMGVIGSFFLGAQFLANSISNCPVEGSVSAQCARDILGIIGTTTAVVNFATDIVACEKVGKPRSYEDFDDDPVGTERRLSMVEVLERFGQ